MDAPTWDSNPALPPLVTGGIEPPFEVLQTSALPLNYVTLSFNTPGGIRTHSPVRDTDFKSAASTSCTTGAYFQKSLLCFLDK